MSCTSGAGPGVLLIIIGLILAYFGVGGRASMENDLGKVTLPAGLALVVIGTIVAFIPCI